VAVTLEPSHFVRALHLKSLLLKIKIGYSKYKALLLTMLVPLGIWGPFAIATTDAAAFGIPADPVLIGYVWASREHIWLIVFYCLSSAIGSTIGSLVPYWIGRGGGELLLLKRIDQKKLEELRDKFESQEFFFIMIPCLLPPGTPFKLFVLCAGVFEMRVPLFMLAIFTGRTLRCAILAYLTVQFGESVLDAFKNHAGMIFSVLGAAFIVYLCVWLWRKRNSAVLA
jgi:membrane protein YqaA with SNARE-associated domain